MKVATAWSTANGTQSAVNNTYKQIIDTLGTRPSWLVAYPSVGYNADTFIQTIKDLDGETPFHGATSCLGAMTGDGFHAYNGRGLGMMAIHDPEGSYGVGAAELNGDSRQASAHAIMEAINNAQRYGEPPDLVWLSGVPGHEEAILQGIQDVIGENVPIAGGSAADNTMEGEWIQFTNGNTYTNAVVVSVLYPSVRIHHAFYSGYMPTEHRGIVTKAEGRRLFEIDGKPAADVYDTWTKGIIGNTEGNNILAAASLSPIGRYIDASDEQPFYLLAHPAHVAEDGAIELLANVQTGDDLVLMSGTEKTLITRAGRGAQSALQAGRITASDISGALVVYSASCMLTVHDEMDHVVEQIGAHLGTAPFLGTFTFGEQGRFIGGDNYHGNLMISVVVFEK